MHREGTFKLNPGCPQNSVILMLVVNKEDDKKVLQKDDVELMECKEEFERLVSSSAIGKICFDKKLKLVQSQVFKDLIVINIKEFIDANFGNGLQIRQVKCDMAAKAQEFEADMKKGPACKRRLRDASMFGFVHTHDVQPASEEFEYRYLAALRAVVVGKNGGAPLMKHEQILIGKTRVAELAAQRCDVPMLNKQTYLN